ncbi:MAG TPA: hypoxanthine phosphoribosyltransferase [Fibrobacteria bacterium]|jgi:hypoxanthine phosphoribosyltransferase|nr:hypoxanthine phosphoribosyltransferase [Fibrobacteria bacterium]
MRILLSQQSIAARVAELGAMITRDYTGKDLVLACVLKGGFIFAADLARAIDLPLRVEFLRGESYGACTESSGAVRVTLEPDTILAGKDVLLVEDIVDTGRTSSQLLEVLQAHRPKSLKVCSLLHKPAREVVPLPLHYLGFTIDDLFVVGYGLDRNGLHRNLPYIGVEDT